MSSEPNTHECTDFAGVTIIFRTASNLKISGNNDGRARNSSQDSRRKSDQNLQLNVQEKVDNGGIIFLL